jgi:hypothetical protein
VLQRSMEVLATWLARGWRSYLTHWRVSFPATVGAVIGLWFSSFVSAFGVDSDFATPLGLPAVSFRLLVVIVWSIAFGIGGKAFLERHFPRQ